MRALTVPAPQNRSTFVRFLSDPAGVLSHVSTQVPSVADLQNCLPPKHLFRSASRRTFPRNPYRKENPTSHADRLEHRRRAWVEACLSWAAANLRAVSREKQRKKIGGQRGLVSQR